MYHLQKPRRLGNLRSSKVPIEADMHVNVMGTWVEALCENCSIYLPSSRNLGAGISCGVLQDTITIQA
jgi:hypothetical protein